MLILSFLQIIFDTIIQSVLLIQENNLMEISTFV